jgi:hypothetical protein
MKYIFIYIYLLFFKVINAFTPFFIKKCFFSYKINNIIKSLSGLLQDMQYKNKKLLDNPNTIIEVHETNCDVNIKECKTKLIIPGYMDHDPKIAAFKKLIK